MTQAERFDLLETSIDKLTRLRDELLGNAETDLRVWNGEGNPPIQFSDGSVYNL